MHYTYLRHYLLYSLNLQYLQTTSQLLYILPFTPHKNIPRQKILNQSHFLKVFFVRQIIQTNQLLSIFINLKAGSNTASSFVK